MKNDTELKVGDKNGKADLTPNMPVQFFRASCWYEHLPLLGEVIIQWNLYFTYECRKKLTVSGLSVALKNQFQQDM